MAAKKEGEPHTPLYRQISDEIREEIQKGNLRKGMRLPSEAAMAKKKQVAVGTVKKAYSDLERSGLVYKIRGGGAYVSENRCGGAADGEETPEETIERVIRELSQSGLRMNQIYSIIQSQTGRVFSGKQKIEAALVDCNLEIMHHVMGDLETVPGLYVEPFLLSELFSGEKVIGSQYSLALVSQKHFDEFIRYADSIHLRTEVVALRESRETIARLTVIPDWQEVCIVYRSREFLESVQYTLKGLGKRNKLLCIEEKQLEDTGVKFSEDQLPLIIPPDYMDYSSARLLQIVGRARKTGRLVIPFEFEIDKGSLLHLKRVLDGLRTREAGLGI